MAFIIRKREAIPADDPATISDPEEEFYAVPDGDVDGSFFGPAKMEELIDSIKDEGSETSDFLFLPVACARTINLTTVVEFENAAKKGK